MSLSGAPCMYKLKNRPVTTSIAANHIKNLQKRSGDLHHLKITRTDLWLFIRVYFSTTAAHTVETKASNWTIPVGVTNCTKLYSVGNRRPIRKNFNKCHAESSSHKIKLTVFISAGVLRLKYTYVCTSKWYKVRVTRRDGANYHRWFAVLLLFGFVFVW